MKGLKCKYLSTCQKIVAPRINYLNYYRKDVSLPQQLQKAMAAEAEASREARAKVIAAEGEMKASRALKEAADVISESPAALQVCIYLLLEYYTKVLYHIKCTTLSCKLYKCYYNFRRLQYKLSKCQRLKKR